MNTKMFFHSIFRNVVKREFSVVKRYRNHKKNQICYNIDRGRANESDELSRFKIVAMPLVAHCLMCLRGLLGIRSVVLSERIPGRGQWRGYRPV